MQSENNNNINEIVVSQSELNLKTMQPTWWNEPESGEYIRFF